MKLTYFANACALYESNNYKILSDPWLIDGAFESWAHFPPLKTKPEDLHDINALYISHVHQDHLHPPTLERLPKVPVIYLDHGLNLVRKNMEKLGFKDFIPIKDKETVNLGPFELTMYAPFTPILHYTSQIGNLIDSALVLKADGVTIFNANDNLPTIESSQMILKRHGPITLAQLCDSCAGPYPMCFRNLSHEEKIKEKDRILERHLNSMIECAKVMQAKYMMPWAGHYQLQGRLVELNQYLAVYNPEEIVNKIKSSGLNALWLDEADTFYFDSYKTIVADNYNHLKFDEWKTEVKDRAYLYDSFLEPLPEQLIEMCQGARHKMLDYQHTFSVWPDWNFTIKAGHMSYQDSFNKKENCKYINFFIDPKCLWGILTRKLHWNDMELGCHIEMDRQPNEYNPDVHLLMSFFHL